MKISIKNLLLTSSFVFLLLGCTGRIQTNPIPNEDKFNLPEKQYVYKNKINGNYIADFKQFANANLNTNKRESILREFKKNNYKSGLWGNAYLKASE